MAVSVGVKTSPTAADKQSQSSSRDFKQTWQMQRHKLIKMCPRNPCDFAGKTRGTIWCGKLEL